MSVISTEVLAAETLADMLFAAQSNPAMTSLVVRAFRRFSESGTSAIPLKDVAAELHVTLPTVRDWISRGVLVEVPATPRAVSLLSLAAVLAAQRSSDSEHADSRPLAKLIDALEDQQLLSLARKVATDPTTQFLTYADEDLETLANL